ncbi:MAG: fatty acid desaturase [Synechococcaceae cyanobacterium ELA263]
MPNRSAVGRTDFELKPYMVSSDWIGAWQLVNTLVPYAALWWLALWSLHAAPWLLPPVLALMVLFLARCFSLMHDCGHYSLFRSRRANRWLGFLLGIVAGIPQLPWSRGHEFHHRHNGNWERYKGPSALVSVERYQQMTPGGQRLYRWLRHPLMLFPGGFFYLVLKPRLELLLGLWGFIPDAIQQLQANPQTPWNQLLARHKSRFWHSPEEAVDLLLNNLAVVSLWWLMAIVVGAGNFWLIYSPVMACGAAIFICIFFVQHNFPGSYAHSNADWDAMEGTLEGTSDLRLPAILDWFSADIGCHAIHHLCAAIPNYRLRDCQNQNSQMLTGITQLSLRDIPSCFNYILWNQQAGRLTTADGLLPQRKTRLST